MSAKNLVLIINANQGYIRNTDPAVDFSLQNEILFTAMTETYIPLLNLFSSLAEEKIPFKLGLVISSQLAELLSDPQIQKQYIDYLDRCIALGKSEEKRTEGTEFHENAVSILQKIENIKHDFVNKYSQNLIEAFTSFARRDYLELIPTAATYAFLPHYGDLTEALNAQVETGLYSQRQFFGEMGEGFFLPYQGYCRGLDNVIHSYGIHYTIVDPRSILFSHDIVNTGIFRPVRTHKSLVLFGSDREAAQMILGEDGFINNEVYRSNAKDIGYELSSGELKDFLGKDGARSGTPYHYWKKGGDDPGEETERYNEDEALRQVASDAGDFAHAQIEKLNMAQPLMGGKKCVSVCVLPAEIFGGSWHEGIDFLEHLIREIALSSDDVHLEFCRNLTDNIEDLQKIEPYPAADDDSGYGEDLLDDSNSWMFRYIRKATERMIDLTERLPSETSLKGRLLNLAAKEVLLAQSGQWPKMLHDGNLPEYVTDSFKRQILSFTTIFNALASNTVSTEWLTKKEKKDAIYPWMNYRIFSRKK